MYLFLEISIVVLFGLSTGTKDEFRIFEEYKFNSSPLVPVLNPKSTTFSNFFLGICTGPNTLFLDLKKF
jgi:hypothetical protein